MIDALLGVLGTLIYPLFSVIFLLMDGIEGLFKAFAGTGSVEYDHGSMFHSKKTVIDNDITQIFGPDGDQHAGILYYFFNSDLIQNLFGSILILAIFLIIIFTVLAFIKNVYSSKRKTWQQIIGGTFIGLANFIFIPVCCLLGVMFGNILLEAINGATSPAGNETSFSRKLFISSAYNANEIRYGSWDECLPGGKLDIDAKTDGILWTEGECLGEKLQKLVDDCGLSDRYTIKDGLTKEECAQIVDACYSITGGNARDIYSWWGVETWYRLVNFNYIIMIAGGIFSIYALVFITFGMVKRMFILLMLFVISPALCALYPLDDGNAVKSYTGKVKENILSAYGAVAGMNLFYAIIPLIDGINMPGFNVLDLLGLTSLLLMIAGLYVVKDFISMITSFVGGGNAYSDGAGLAGSVKGTYGKVTGTAKKFRENQRKIVKGAINATSSTIRGTASAATWIGRGAKNVFYKNYKDAASHTTGKAKGLKVALKGTGKTLLSGISHLGEVAAIGLGGMSREEIKREIDQAIAGSTDPYKIYQSVMAGGAKTTDYDAFEMSGYGEKELAMLRADAIAAASDKAAVTVTQYKRNAQYAENDIKKIKALKAADKGYSIAIGRRKNVSTALDEARKKLRLQQQELSKLGSKTKKAEKQAEIDRTQREIEGLTARYTAIEEAIVTAGAELQKAISGIGEGKVKGSETESRARAIRDKKDELTAAIDRGESLEGIDGIVDLLKSLYKVGDDIAGVAHAQYQSNEGTRKAMNPAKK
ncbi:MAG: hypothetical protein E7374_00510 [Clostridiales bacterium]|nr:hypothetical protein [Clostridiales bacterium]